MNKVKMPERAVRRKKPHASTQFWVLDPDQLVCVASSRRQDILDLVSARGPMSAAEIAAQIGVKRTALYRHLAELKKVDLIGEAGSRVVNRRVEKLYMTPSRKMRLALAISNRKNTAAIQKILSAMCRQTMRDMKAGLEAPAMIATGVKKNYAFARLIGAPTPKTLAKVNQKFEEIIDLVRADGWAEDRPLISISWMATPLPPP